MTLHDRIHSSLPTQSAWTGLYLLYMALASPVPLASPEMALHAGLFGLFAGVGLEQSRKKAQSMQRALSIQQHITVQTRGRIHDLTVRLHGDRACIEGYTASYHLKQLAHFAAIDILGSDGGSALDFNVRVRKSRSSAAEC